jgi:putative aldouronate transport system substrate-binding protein
MNAKRLTVLLVILALLVSMLAACGEKKEEEQAATTPSTETEETSAVNFFGKDSASDPDIEATILAIEVANPAYPENNTRDDNVWSRYYKETLGVTLVNKEVVPEAQATEKINALIGTNDLPDLLKLGTPEFNTAASNDQLADLTEVYEKYASPLTKKILSADGGIALGTATVGGKLMGIPLAENSTNATNVLWIRKDWLEANGLQIPTTTAGLKEVAKVFKQKYGVGIPVTAKADLNSFNGIFNSFNVFPGWVKDANGQLVNGMTTDNAKNAVKYLNELYKEGLIPKEFASDDNIYAPLSNNQAGIFYFAWWAPYWPIINAVNLTDENGNKVPQKDADGNEIKNAEGQVQYVQTQVADWVPAYIPSGSADGSKVKLNGTGKPGLYWAVSADFEQPEILIKMLNQFYEKFAGEQATADAEKFISGPNGENYWQFAFPYNWDINKDIPNYEAYLSAIASRDETKLQPGGDFGKAVRYTQFKDVLAYLDGDRTLPKWQAYAAFGPNSAHTIYVDAIKNSNLQVGDYFGPSSPTEVELGGELSKIVLEEYVKMITSKGDLDAQFAAFVKKWNDAGGAKVTEEVNAYKK